MHPAICTHSPVAASHNPRSECTAEATRPRPATARPRTVRRAQACQWPWVGRRRWECPCRWGHRWAHLWGRRWATRRLPLVRVQVLAGRTERALEQQLGRNAAAAAARASCRLTLACWAAGSGGWGAGQAVASALRVRLHHTTGTTHEVAWAPHAHPATSAPSMPSFCSLRAPLLRPCKPSSVRPLFRRGHRPQRHRLSHGAAARAVHGRLAPIQRQDVQDAHSHV